MSKKNKKPKKKAAEPKSQAKPVKKAAAKGSLLNRRNAIKLLIAAPVAGLAGAAIHRYDVQNRDLHDLSSIGQGSPVIVQVHDPSCQLCRQLMNNTRKAIKTRDDLVYRVADLTTAKGATFGREHSAQKVTLLLFNDAGKQVGRVEGVTSVQELTERFSSL